MFPYKGELSVGKMKFAAVGDNDLHLTGDLRDTVGGFINGGSGGMGSMAFMVFSPLEVPEPVVLNGQEEERHTYIKE